MPKTYPLQGAEGYPLLTYFAEAFHKSGFHTLQLGKPGVEFFHSWEKVTSFSNFYDKRLWSQLKWNDLVINVEDAVQFLRRDPNVGNIYLLGHSEGTVVASDVAAKNPEITGVVLLGYAGESIISTLKWQTFDRQIEDVISSDIDSNRDGFITEAEAKLWPPSALFPPTFLGKNKSWDWVSKDKISLEEVAEMWHADSELKENVDIEKWIKRFPFWSDFVKRDDIKETTASIRGTVHVFAGEFDVNTPPQWAFDLQKVCKARQKNCNVRIVKGVTHKFARVNESFAGPKFNKVLDQGLNPVDPDFLDTLTSFALELRVASPPTETK